MEKKIVEILRGFNIEGELKNVEVIHNGNINSTIFISVLNKDKTSDFILQKINKYVFKKPDEVMENIIKVTDHIIKKLKSEGKSVDKKTLQFYLDENKKPYVIDNDGDYWREGTTWTMEAVTDKDLEFSKEEIDHLLIRISTAVPLL